MSNRKTWLFALCLVHFTPATFAASVANEQAAVLYAVTERGDNYRIWEGTVYEASPRGSAPKTHRYTELATGLHFQRNGQWHETIEKFELLPNGNGACATNGPHQLYVPGDIYEGVIRAIGPDGRTQQMRPWGIS